MTKQANTNRLTNLGRLAEAQRLDLLCEVVQGLGCLILRIERTEGEIARGSRAYIAELVQLRGLRLAY